MRAVPRCQGRSVGSAAEPFLSSGSAPRPRNRYAAREQASTGNDQPVDILDAIGNTPLVRLRKVIPPDRADVFVKLESEDPTGSVIDRMAHAVISRAEEDDRLKPGDTVVEYTRGSTGASLALVCAAKGYRLQIVSSDALSQDKLDQMVALGAELTLVRARDVSPPRSRSWT